MGSGDGFYVVSDDGFYVGSDDGFYVGSDDGFYVGSDDGFMLVLRMFHMTIFMLNPNTISSLKRSLSSESERNCDIFSQWLPLFFFSSIYQRFPSSLGCTFLNVLSRPKNMY